MSSSIARIEARSRLLWSRFAALTITADQLRELARLSRTPVADLRSSLAINRLAAQPSARPTSLR